MPAYTRSTDMKQFKEGDRIVVARGNYKGERGHVVSATNVYRQADVHLDCEVDKRYSYSAIVHEKTYDRYYA